MHLTCYYRNYSLCLLYKLHYSMPPVNVHIVLRSDDCVMAMANNYPEADV